jgi:protein O-GlcNAc transferase
MPAAFVNHSPRPNPGSGEAQRGTSGEDAQRLLEQGMAFEETRCFPDALDCYDAALRLVPDLGRAHFNRGNVLLELDDPLGAVDAYTTALKHKPDSAAAHYNMGNAHTRLGQKEVAIAAYQKAITLKPEFADARVAMGVALQDLGRIDEAIASYRQALDIRPDYAEVHYNLGSALAEAGNTDEAIASFQQALLIRPDYAEALSSMGNSMKDLGLLKEAIESYEQALNSKPNHLTAHSGLLFTHNYLNDQASSRLLADALHFGALVAQQARPYTSWNTPPDTNRCLRLGIVSADLRQHPVGYFSEGVLSALASRASERLELHAYSNHVQFDSTSEQIKACCQSWCSTLGLSDESLAQRIHRDRIDILIDLSGHTGDNRLPLFAWKPAPVQVSWLGYFATTGVKAIDYLIADPWTLPESEEINFSETIWRLPETRLCFTPPNVPAPFGILPALANGYITFGCFNNLAKMNDEVVTLWAQILASVPESRLFLKAKQFFQSSVRQCVIERFSRHNVDPGRLILEGPVPRADYLAAYNRVDIALDPFPYTGGTTTVEALWMGVPVLTLAGKQFLARQGVGLLMNAGLPEWVATDQDDYLSRAVAHASDLQRLVSLRALLRQKVLASPVFDAPRFARHFEAALRGMWKKWCRDQGAAF